MNFGIILAAGAGKRFGSEKQLKMISNIPLYQYSVDIFCQAQLFDEIILVCSAGKSQDFKVLPVSLVEGGKERHESVLNALKYLGQKYSLSDQDRVLIHDSARPLIQGKYISQVLQALNEYPAATLGYKITDALKHADEKGMIQNDVDRKNLWAVTTPQGFHLKKLIGLYQKTIDSLYDETRLFTENNLPVKIIEAGRHNLKVTYPEDFEAAKKLLGKE